jgi:amino acid adenylation domain-containing protein
MRARLVRLVDGGGALLVTLHHVVADGWSMKVFFQEFLALYRDGSAAALPALGARYIEFTQWQHDIERAERAAPKQLAYWRRQLGDNLHGFSLPTDRARPPIQTYAGGRVVSTIPAGLTRGVRDLALREGVTLFVTLLAAYQVLLSRYAQQDDIVVGSVVANRDRSAFAQLIGFVVNVLVLRTDLAGDPRFVEALRRVHRVVLDGYANHQLSFEVLVEELQPQRDLSRSPLFQIAFDLRDPEIVRSPLPDVSVSVMEPDLGACQYDVHLTVEERGAELVAYWQYNRDLFDAATIERMARNFETLLAGIVSEPDARLSRLPIVSRDEADLLARWNSTASPYPVGRRVHELFEDWVDRTPDAPALVFRDTTLTYAELERRSNRWAHKLRALGVERDMPVGVCLDRSIEGIVAVLAILKAGGAFLPLDPAYPKDRLAFMVRDSKIRLIVSDSRLAGRFGEPGLRIVEMDREAEATQRLAAERPRTQGSASDLAYVIYTSGSTGVPKGVLVEHHGWCNVSAAEQTQFGLRPGMRVLQFASPSFDASAFEIAMALCSGGTLVIADGSELMPGAPLERLLRAQRVEVITVPPSALAALPSGPYPDLKIITVAGEACPAEVVDQWARPPARFFNLYGPTETTIWASFVECFAGSGAPPPIGKPVPNMQLHVLDRNASALPIGMPGELYIGGEGVTRGYLDRPELNAARFVPDGFAARAGARMYRSGDLVRWNASGQVEFLGRLDHQVKLRGFRIELGEIEALLRRYDAVSEAVVAAREVGNDERALVAYVAPSAGRTLGADALRAHLRNFLPAYMIPARIVVMDALPFTPNGKIDRARLPDPDRLAAEAPVAANLPQNDLERTIAAVWQDVLDVRHVDREQNFFDAGGHSLKMAQVHARLSAELDVPIELVELFQYPSVSTLAAHLAGRDRPASPKASAVPVAQIKRRVFDLAERQRAMRRNDRNDH